MDYFILTHFFRPFLFFVRSPSSTYNIEQVAGFHYDGAIGRPAEHVFLAVAEYIAQAVVVTAFQKEMSDFGIDLKTCTGCDAIFKFVLYRHVVLLVYLSRTEAQGRVVEKPTFVPLVA